MKHQNIGAFQKQLEDPKKKSRLYLIAIEDDFERKRWLDRILSLVRSPDQPFTSCRAGESSLSELFTELSSLSLFSSEPIYVIDEVEKLSKKQTQQFIDFLTKFPMPGYLILGSRGKTSLSSAVEALGAVLDLCEEKPWEKEKRLTDQIFYKVRQAGKTLSSEAFQKIFDRLDKDTALLELEIDKLLCFTANRNRIELSDVMQICSANRTQTLWQIAEEMIWEGHFPSSIDEELFYGLIPALRYQLQLGLKLVSFLESSASFPEISAKMSKIRAKLLEKRMAQGAKLGASYFKKALDFLFRIELLSRSGSPNIGALFDWFRISLIRTKK